MPQVIFSTAAIRDLERLHHFLRSKNAPAAERAAATILKGAQSLAAHPQMGRLVDDLPEDYREWLIEFGSSGYVVRYRLSPDMITILAVRHQREAGF